MMFVLFLIVMVVLAVVKTRLMDQQYTFGSGMFKNSDNNLHKKDHLDVSDYDYYNDKGKLK